MIFYFDNNIAEYEKKFQWDLSLEYLNKKFKEKPSVEILNSLIGFSWYYLVEGPLESGKFANDKCTLGLIYWKKYIDIGLCRYNSNSSFNFIAGYTLYLHGFLIDKKFDSNYENLSIELMKKCSNQIDKSNINKVALQFLQALKKKKYTFIKISKDILQDLFSGGSLLEKYFIEIYS